MDDLDLHLALEALRTNPAAHVYHERITRGMQALEQGILTPFERAALLRLLARFPISTPPSPDPVAALIAAFQHKLPDYNPAAVATAIQHALAQRPATLNGAPVTITMDGDTHAHQANLAIGNQVGGNLVQVTIPIPDARFDALLVTALRTHEQERTLARIQHAAQQIESDRLLTLRLQGFVGRVTELTAIREQIAAMRPTGGYVLIKAAAGEGKSSSIAKLIQQAGITQTPHHFIALTTGREYQLGLLRAVVAQLILKHGLTVSYFPEESYPAMKGEFARILDELSNHGIEETIYLDGLDQLQPESDGSRDLSFLPPQPPPGIVIVLGSRPDETLKPLEILHRVDYDLPPLSQEDALELWRSVQPAVADSLLHDLYAALKGNALFVHLAADTMRDQSLNDATSLIRQIEQNPSNLFGITLERMKGRSRSQWDTVWKPMLALLLVAQEPLRLDVLGDLLGHDHDTMQDAVWVLGGLVSQGIDHRIALHHLLFRDYLAGSVFNAREMKRWQQRLADWCAVDLNAIWADDRDLTEQARRMYARHHYVTHLALAENWLMLWQVLDAGDYGEQKTRFDPSTRLYALDLDRGRESVISAGQSTEDHIQNLPRLWKYSLLRTSLTSRVDQWQDEVFEVLAMVGRTQEALERIELVSDPKRQIGLWRIVFQWCNSHQKTILINRMQAMISTFQEQDKDNIYADIIKIYVYANNITEAYRFAQLIRNGEIRAEAFYSIAKLYATSHNIEQCSNLLKEAFEALHLIDDSISGPLYHRIIQTLASIDMINEAIIYANQINHPYDRSYALQIIVSFIAQKKDFNHASNLAYTIETSFYFLYGLISIAFAYADSGYTDDASILLVDIIRLIDILTDTRQSLQVHITLAEIYAKLEDNEQRNRYLHKALTLIHSIESIEEQVKELCSLSQMYNQMMMDIQRDVCLDNAITLAHTLDEPAAQGNAFNAISKAYAVLGDLDHATTVSTLIEDYDIREMTLGQIIHIVLNNSSNCDSQAVLTEVRNITQSISHPWWRVQCIHLLIYTYVSNGNIDQARTLLESELQILSHAIDRDTLYIRENTLCSITKYLVSIDDFTSAKKLTAFIHDRGKYVDALCAIASRYIFSNDLDLALGSINEAIDVIQHIDNPEDKVYALGYIANTYAIMMRTDQAIMILKDAFDTALLVDSEQYIYVIDDIARIHTRIGNIDEAMAIVDSIKENDGLGVYTPLYGIACVLAEAGEVDLALEVTKSIRWFLKDEAYHAIAQAYCIAGDQIQAKQIAQSIKERWKYVKTLSVIARSYVAINNAEQAKELIAEMIASIDIIASDEHYDYASSSLVQAVAAIGDIDQATTILQSINTTESRDEAVCAIAHAYADHGKLEDAIAKAKSIIGIQERVAALLSISKDYIDKAISRIVLIQKEWQASKTIDDTWGLLQLITPLLNEHPGLGTAILEEERWVNEQLRRLA